MGYSLFEFLSEMIAFCAVPLFLWGGFQLISYICVKYTQMNKRTPIREGLAEVEAHDRQIWADVA